ncbi:RNA-binding domain-containing protein [Bifidobacterium simiarum]|uniref:RNA-binding domain-containing protein n=1 Tax=Bifidobacterium simiarum TaxID=2045441 RepID=UPI001BDDAF05|nr:RNA-binding domain-containing protein [Bifidobacterium simiarum]MBT1167068.1 putative DNA binding domain-containing protein [Bifidobacterium simiarum]
MAISGIEGLRQFLSGSESRRLEFKTASKQFDSDKLMKYCCALSCEGGGEMVFGVNDDKKIVGTQAFPDTAKTERDIYNRLGIRCTFEMVEADGRRVLILHIPRSIIGHPASFDGQYWMRNGESLEFMSPERLRELLNEAAPSFLDENEPGTYTWGEVTSRLAVERYYELTGSRLPNEESQIMDFLRLHFVERTAFDPRLFYIRRLGAVTLARSLRDFPDVEYHTIRVMRLRGSSITDLAFDRIYDKGYALVFSDVIDQINSLLPTRETFEDGLRKESRDFPEVAVREIVANACVHQNFDEHGSIDVTVGDQRITVSNPGIPEIPVNRFVDEVYERNESLSEALRMMRICEKRGSGIDRALENIEGQQTEAPEFVVKSRSTTVSLKKRRFDDMGMKERVNAAYLHCCLQASKGEYLTNSSLRARFGLAKNKSALISQLISTTVNQGLIFQDPATAGSRRTARYLPFYCRNENG